MTQGFQRPAALLQATAGQLTEVKIAEKDREKVLDGKREGDIRERERK